MLLFHFLPIWIQCKKCAKEVHTSRSADEAEKKDIPSVALQVPFLTTWEFKAPLPVLKCYFGCLSAMKILFQVCISWPDTNLRRKQVPYGNHEPGETDIHCLLMAAILDNEWICTFRRVLFAELCLSILGPYSEFIPWATSSLFLEMSIIFISTTLTLVTGPKISKLHRSWVQFWPQHESWGHVWLHHIL